MVVFSTVVAGLVEVLLEKKSKVYKTYKSPAITFAATHTQIGGKYNTGISFFNLAIWVYTYILACGRY